MPFNPPPSYDDPPALRQAQDVPSDPLEALRRANAKESSEWLGANSPDHLEAVAYAVEHGVTPEEVYRAVLRDTYRPELAHRCRLAARWLAGGVTA